MVNLKLDIPEPMEDEEDATDKQVQYIRALMREAGASGFPEDVLQDLGKWQASSIIDQLQDLKKQLRGEMPLDEDMISGLDDESSERTSIVRLFLIAAAVVVVLLILMSM